MNRQGKKNLHPGSRPRWRTIRDSNKTSISILTHSRLSMQLTLKTVLIFSAVDAGLFMSLHGALHKGEVPDTTDTVLYTVQQNDTVWNVVSKLDTRDNVQDARDWVIRRNHLQNGQAIQAGDVLVVPVSRGG